MLKRRLSTPRAATVVALAAVLAAAVAVTPSFAGTSIAGVLPHEEGGGADLPHQQEGVDALPEEKGRRQPLVKKAEAPLPPVAGIAAGTALFGADRDHDRRLHPDRVHLVRDQGTGSAVITFSGKATCTAEKPTADLACPIQILVDGQTTGKVNFAPATAATPTPAPLVHTVMQTTVLQKGGHTVAIQYAGAEKVTFTLKSWNLAVQAYPERPKNSRPKPRPPRKRANSPQRSDRWASKPQIWLALRPIGGPDRARPGRARGLVPADAEAAGARQGLAEDQAGPVVEGLKSVSSSSIRCARARAGWRGFCRPSSGGSLAKTPFEPAARDERRVVRCDAHRLSPFLSLLTI